MSADRIWSLTISALLAVLLIFGGSSLPGFVFGQIITLSSLAVLAAALARLWTHGTSGLGLAGLGIGLAAAVLVGLQLVPLPPDLWMNLPGRAAIAEGLDAAGVAGGYQPLSLAPAQTRADLIALLPPLALFTAALTASRAERHIILGTLLIAGVLSVMLGLMQRFQGPDSTLFLHEEAVGPATGTFANRNFFAAQLYTLIPLLAALVLHWIRQRHFNPYLLAGLGLVLLFALLAGLGATGSRAGILLAMAAVLLAGLAAFGQGAERAAGSRRAGLLAVAVAILLIGQTGLVGILRLVESDPVADYRSVISRVSLEALWAYFPWGSGFGSFVPVYAMFETPASMNTNYVNHAHNDWLELVMEGGLPAALLLLAGTIWLVVAAVRGWLRHEGHVDGVLRASAIAALLLLVHSLGDYPLRTPYLMGFFGLMAGFLALGHRHHHRKHRHARPAHPDPAPVAQPRPARKPGPYFVRKDREGQP